MPFSCLVCSSTLKMEATCSFKTSVKFQQATRRGIPEGRIIYFLAHPAILNWNISCSFLVSSFLLTGAALLKIYTSFPLISVKLAVRGVRELITVAEICTEVRACGDSWFRMLLSTQTEIACFLASQSVDLPLSASRLKWRNIASVSSGLYKM
jgi:hypothetical protein